MTGIDDLPLPHMLERNRNGPVAISGISSDRLILSGRSNYSVPAQGFADSIAASDDEQLVQTTEEIIWLSAYADNNPASDYHWQASACYYEAQRRGNAGLYEEAYERARRSAGLLAVNRASPS
jgi:hypothetical protein